MGIIDSLSAGYRFVGRRLELLLIPILFDLLLWFAPRLSIAPLLEQLAGFYATLATVDGLSDEMREMTEQVPVILTEAGQTWNLLDMLISGSLLHVPSLITLVGPTLQGSVIEVANVLAAFGLFALFRLTGILFGVIYMNLLASRLPLGSAPKPTTVGGFIVLVLRHYGMVLLYLGLIFVLMVAATVPASIAAALLSLVSPALGPLLIILVSGLIIIIFFYLYFVTAALILDNLPIHQAIVQSFSLVRAHFWSTLGFVILMNLIGGGIALMMRQLATIVPLGTVAAILVNAFVGTGLAMALLVFYRTRVLRDTVGEELAYQSVEWNELK